MSNLPAPRVVNTTDHVRMMQIAREIASDMRPLADILKAHMVSDEEWSELSNSHRFQALLASSLEEWQGVANTAERVRIKSLAFVEESLPEFYARAHDPKETLSSKVELLKAVSRLGGIGGPVDVGGGGAERMVVNINLGADHKLTFAREVTPQVTIDQ